jgi:CRP-like cAMP-binding protein
LENLIELLRHNYSISIDEATVLSDYFKLESLAKGEFYLKEGAACYKLSFICSGIMRLYRVNDNREVTQWISTEGYFVTDLASLSYGMPARWNIQALTDCEYYTISKDVYEGLKEVLPSWPEIEKRFLTKCFIILEERVHKQISLSAEERYDDLMQFDPSLFNEVPLQFLASMLGMSPETLSRIRAKKSS